LSAGKLTTYTDPYTALFRSITFASTVNADDAAVNNRTLTVTAAGGAVTFGDVVGGTQPLADLDVTAATINLNGGTYQIDDQGGKERKSTGLNAVTSEARMPT